MDFIDFIERQRRFSELTFGPGSRKAGIIMHIAKELVEIAEANDEEVLDEWIDAILLAIDGAWRSGGSPERIADALERKLLKNSVREWPNWRDIGIDQPIEHIKQ